MPFNVSEAFDPEFLEPIDVITRTGSYDANGRFGITSQIPIPKLACVQPAKSTDLNNLPEGAEAVGAKAFYTTFQLTQDDENFQTVADLVIHKSKIYKITSVAYWDTYGYYRSIGTYQRDP